MIFLKASLSKGLCDLCDHVDSLKTLDNFFRLADKVSEPLNNLFFHIRHDLSGHFKRLSLE